MLRYATVPGNSGGADSAGKLNAAWVVVYYWSVAVRMVLFSVKKKIYDPFFLQHALVSHSNSNIKPLFSSRNLKFGATVPPSFLFGK